MSAKLEVSIISKISLKKLFFSIVFYLIVILLVPESVRAVTLFDSNNYTCQGPLSLCSLDFFDANSPTPVTLLNHNLIFDKNNILGWSGLGYNINASNSVISVSTFIQGSTNNICIKTANINVFDGICVKAFYGASNNLGLSIWKVTEGTGTEARIYDNNYAAPARQLNGIQDFFWVLYDGVNLKVTFDETVVYNQPFTINPITGVFFTSFNVPTQWSNVLITNDTGIPPLAPRTNQPPVISQISNTAINEGDVYLANGSFIDVSSTSWTATVDYGDGTGTQPLTLSGTNFSLNHLYKDNGIYTTTVSITDNQGATATATAIVTVNNIAPSVSAITLSANPIQINTSTTVSATFFDPGVLDTHTVSWNFGDGTTNPGPMTISHTYTQAGVYTITLTVTDKDGGQGTSTFEYLVVFNTTGGFITGAGRYDSPDGEVHFGVNANYLPVSNVLNGQAKINFKIGDRDFATTSLRWLVVSGTKAILTGNGTINGSGNYNLLLSGIDGGQTSKQYFIRIKITDSENKVIYDTQTGAPDNADPTTLLTNGVIKIH